MRDANALCSSRYCDTRWNTIWHYVKTKIWMPLRVNYCGSSNPGESLLGELANTHYAAEVLFVNEVARVEPFIPRKNK